MNILKLPGCRSLLIAMIVMGLFFAPVVLAEVPESLLYGMEELSGASAAQPAWVMLSGPYALGSVSAYGSVSSWTPSSHLDFSETAAASGKITSFSYSFHYEG